MSVRHPGGEKVLKAKANGKKKLAGVNTVAAFSKNWRRVRGVYEYRYKTKIKHTRPSKSCLSLYIPIYVQMRSCVWILVVLREMNSCLCNTSGKILSAHFLLCTLASASSRRKPVRMEDASSVSSAWKTTWKCIHLSHLNLPLRVRIKPTFPCLRPSRAKKHVCWKATKRLNTRRLFTFHYFPAGWVQSHQDRTSLYSHQPLCGKIWPDCNASAFTLSNTPCLIPCAPYLGRQAIS